MAAERTTIELQKISEFVEQLDGLGNIEQAIVYGVDQNGTSVKITCAQLTDHTTIENRLTTVEGKAESNRTNIASINSALPSKSNVGHTHTISDVTDLQTALNGKAATIHSHTISDITDLQTALNGKAATIHSHAISDVADLQTALNGKSNTGHSHAISDVAGLSGELANKAPLNHTHTIPQIEQLQSQIVTMTSNITDIQAEVDSMGIAFGLPLVDDLTTYDAEVGKIVKYVGTTTSFYTHGYNYEKTSDGWVLSNSQPDNTSALSDRITTNANNITTISNKIGSANGIAELDGNGKVPQSQLPSFVDDVVEYASLSNFPATGESGKIYIATDTNITYRWGNSTYVPIGSDLALGETASTAYRGDRGKTAYDHSQTQGNPHGTTIAQISGLQTALDGKQPTIGKNEFFKQVSDLDNYNAQNGEIVEYIGQTNSKYKHGLTYKYIQGETIEVPRGYYYINLDNNHILVSSRKTATGIAQYMNVINKNGSYYTFFCKQSLSGHTPTDWNAIVQQKLANKLLVMKSDSGVKSWIKVVSITGEQISDYTWKFSTLTLEDGMVINREDITATSGSVASDILIDLNDSNSPDYYAIPDTPPIVSPTVINGCLFPTMQCGVGFNGSQKWASSEIEIDTSEWQHIKTTDTSTIESNIAALQTSKANEVTSFTESSTRTNIASGNTVTTIWGKIKKWFTDLKEVAFSGSYNDLNNKPLSVESNKVKYILSDGTTKLTLVQDSELSTVAITNDYNSLNNKPSKNYAIGTTRSLITSENKSSDSYSIATDIIKGEYYIVNFDMIISSTITFSAINPIYIYYNNGSFLWIVSGGTYQVGEYHITKRIKIPDTFNNAEFYITANDSSERGKVQIKNCRIERENDDGWQPNTSDEQIYFTSDTSSVRANIQSGDTIAQMAKIVNSNFGYKFINNSDFEFTSYITDSNLYGIFFSGLGILIICGWFRLITTDISPYSNILRFKGYTPIAGYPKFIDEYSNNVINFKTGEDGKGEWWTLHYRSSANNIYWEGLPTIVIVYKTT